MGRKILWTSYLTLLILFHFHIAGENSAKLYCGNNPTPCTSSVLCPGEELVYEVSWLKISLGQIRLRMSPPTKSNGLTLYHATSYVDSYEGLPLVDLHAIDHSDMDSTCYSLGFHASERKGDTRRFETSHYDLSHKRIYIETVSRKNRQASSDTSVKRDTVYLNDTVVQDGLSILYFARCNVHSHQTIVVPTIVYGKLGQTRFDFSDESDLEEIDAVKDKKIRVTRFDGKAEFEGLFGLTGDFKGWFSDDYACVPIKAEMKVLLGSVKVELVDWKREGWNPPVQ